MCKISINQELNGIELSFDQKPERATLEAIKAQGFRWNGKRSIWYAKQTEERLTFARTLGTLDAQETPAQESATAYNLEGLGENRPQYLGGAELSKGIREELKRRGVRGCSVRVSHYDDITVTVKFEAADLASIEEATARGVLSDVCRDLEHGIYKDDHYIYRAEYDNMTEEEKRDFSAWYVVNEISSFNGIYATNTYELETQGRGWCGYLRRSYPALTAQGFEKLNAVCMIANQWNYNNSDLYTDYHDIGYYLQIDCKKPDGFTVRESMTEAERAGLEAEKEEAARIEAEEDAKREAQRKADEEAAQKWQEYEKAAKERIINNVRVDDLAESEQIYITNLVGGIGKECNRAELDRTIKEYDKEEKKHEAVITRLLTFTDPQAWDDFNNLYLEDFTFLSGKGGTGSEDCRLDNVETWQKLTAEQREDIKIFMCDCVGVVYDDKIQLVIDPEGYSYARYVYIVQEDSEQKPARVELARQRAESEGKTFYIPASVNDQIKNIEPGQDITIYQCDGWMLHDVCAGFGKVAGIKPGTYAQYTGQYITLEYKGKQNQVFIHDGCDCLIYDGIHTLPHEVTHGRIDDHMEQVYTVFDGLFDKVYKYFDSQGINPVVDTIAK